MQQSTFWHTYTQDANGSLSWSYASLLTDGLPKDKIRSLRRDVNWEVTQLPLVTLPLVVVALLRKVSLHDLLGEVRISLQNLGPEYEGFQSQDDLAFAEGLLTRPLIPVGTIHRWSHYGDKSSSLQLLSLVDLMSPTYLPGLHPTDEYDQKEEQPPPQLYWVSSENTSFLLVNHHQAVVFGGGFEPGQLFSVWKTFIEWLFN